MNSRWLTTRRALLGGLGATSLAALLPRRQAAAQTGVPKRFIVVHVPEGMWSDAQRPSANAGTLGPIFSPLDKYQSRLTALDGLNLQSRDNGPGGDGHHRGAQWWARRPPRRVGHVM